MSASKCHADERSGQLDAATLLANGPMAWLEELDILACEAPVENERYGLDEIFAAMAEMDRTGAWYDPKRYVLVWPTHRAPSLWRLLYRGRSGVWQEVGAEVARW